MNTKNFKKLISYQELKQLKLNKIHTFNTELFVRISKDLERVLTSVCDVDLGLEGLQDLQVSFSQVLLATAPMNWSLDLFKDFIYEELKTLGYPIQEIEVSRFETNNDICISLNF